MIKIRLARQGKRHNKFYRILAVDEQKKRNGKALETFGFWQPSKELKEVDVKKISEWTQKGAIVTPAVKTLIK